MAEGWARMLHPGVIEAYSAGIEKHGMDRLAVRAMLEAGVNIGAHESKLLDELDSLDFDYVITLCDHAHESCPLFPGNARMMHQGFDDPKTLTGTDQPDEIRIEPYRRVRDEIRLFVSQLPEIIKQG